MPKGVSVYLGLHYQLQDNLDYLTFAREHGFTKVFTSLHIPEAEYSQVIEEFKIMAGRARALAMELIADISPRTFNYLGCGLKDLKPLKELGLSGIRVDFGFSPAAIAEFTRNPYGMKVEINASTVTEKFLEEFVRTGQPDSENLQASHNYYPRRNTGIGRTTLEAKNRLLKQYGIQRIAAFIPSGVARRGPLFEGLPTLETQRAMEPQIAAKELFALGVDEVILGDALASAAELVTVGRLDERVVELRIATLRPNETERRLLFDGVHHNRPDPAEDLIRSVESRERLTAPADLIPHDNRRRTPGDVTIDNQNYLRYRGELQICLKALPADPRINVVGKVIGDELFLLNYIKEGVAFKFQEWK